jgi:DNA-binding NarL/FixJ family response regulator
MTPVRILIADDHELVRRGLSSILGAREGWEVVAEAEDGNQAITLAETLKPQIAVIDLAMPGQTGLQVTERLQGSTPQTRIIVLTVHSAEPVTRQLRKAGASALLAKKEAPSRLIAAIEAILQGESFFASDQALRSPSELEPREWVPVQYLLTPREMQVLGFLARGYSNKEIAASLEMSVRTVESHRAEILARLNVDSLGELVRMAVRDGIVE